MPSFQAGQNASCRLRGGRQPPRPRPGARACGDVRARGGCRRAAGGEVKAPAAHARGGGCAAARGGVDAGRPSLSRGGTTAGCLWVGTVGNRVSGAGAQCRRRGQSMTARPCLPLPGVSRTHARAAAERVLLQRRKTPAVGGGRWWGIARAAAASARTAVAATPPGVGTGGHGEARRRRRRRSPGHTLGQPRTRPPPAWRPGGGGAEWSGGAPAPIGGW